MKFSAFFFLIFFLCTHSSFGKVENDVFGDFEKDTILFEGHEAYIVVPQIKNEEGNWIWRARFWAHQPQVDIALLKQGFHVVHIDVADMFGCDSAVILWNHFYDYCSNKYALNKKVTLEGMSRGGLIIYNWASKNTDKVNCIYADAPVCDFKSWPAGLYSGEGSPRSWKKCMDVYHLDSISALSYTDLPINNSKLVAKAGIPVIHVYGADDTVVPYAENTALIKATFDNYEAEIKIIKKEGVGHHPHCLKDPTPIVNFILNNTL